MPKSPLNAELVLDAAARIADAEGLDAVTLTRVADSLGVRQPALYRHVDGYDDLIRGLSKRGRERLREELAASAIGVAGEDAVAALGEAWRRVVKAHPGLYAATDRYPCAGDKELEGLVDEIVAILAQATAKFDLDDEQRVHAARTLRSAFHGFAHLESGDGHPLPHDLDDSFAHLIELLCAGIRALELSTTS